MRKKVLANHKKIRKEFIPPLLQFNNIEPISWINYILPELLWIGLLNDYYGLAEGAELSLSVAKAAFNTKRKGKTRWFAPTSSYRDLSAIQKKKAIETLRSDHRLDKVKSALLPFALFYEKFPLNFLFENRNPKFGNESKIMNRLKRCLSHLFNRRNKASTFVQANAIYIAFCTEIFKVKSGLAIANFPAIERYPQTEESKRIAASVRASLNMFFGSQINYKPTSWPKYFWNHGFELEKCDFNGLWRTDG